jgi:hypothetical protein
MTSNTWPGGKRRALSQDHHAAWNASNYPGTRQLCADCEAPTGRCEEDELTTEDRPDEPLCEDCYEAHKETQDG